MDFVPGMEPDNIDIYIDNRAGSNKFLKEFAGRCRDDVRLTSGDICFFGKGHDNAPWSIGIEHKTVSDVVACIKSGRFTGTQLPHLIEDYDMVFLLVEGVVKCATNGMLVAPRGTGGEYSYHIPYKAFTNFLVSVQMFTSISGKPCIVLRSSGKTESVRIIDGLYNYFQKNWDDHVAISNPDSSKIIRGSYQLEFIRPEPGEPDYPRYLLRQIVYQIKGFGWDASGRVAAHFGTLEAAMEASQKEWESIDRVGPTLARRAYESLHGHIDPTAVKKKGKSKNDTRGAAGEK